MYPRQGEILYVEYKSSTGDKITFHELTDCLVCRRSARLNARCVSNRLYHGIPRIGPDTRSLSYTWNRRYPFCLRLPPVAQSDLCEKLYIAEEVTKVEDAKTVFSFQEVNTDSLTLIFTFPFHGLIRLQKYISRRVIPDFVLHPRIQRTGLEMDGYRMLDCTAQ